MTGSPKGRTEKTPRRVLQQYATPRLMVYGALADLTRNVGKTANVDGGKWPKSRSAP